MNHEPKLPINNNTKEKKTERTCNICGKKAMMTRYQRYCGKYCRKKANEIFSTDAEFVTTHKFSR